MADLPADFGALSPEIAADILKPIIDRPSGSLRFLKDKLDSPSVDDKGFAVLVLAHFICNGQLQDAELKAKVLSIIDATDWSKTDPTLRLPVQVARCRVFFDETGQQSVGESTSDSPRRVEPEASQH